MMFRLTFSLKSPKLSTFLLFRCQQRFYAVTAEAVAQTSSLLTVKQDGETSMGIRRLSEEERAQVKNLRKIMFNELKKKSRELCQVAKLSQKEVSENLDKIEQWTLAMHKKLNMPHPFADLIHYCLLNKLAIKDQLYDRYMQSEEFQTINNDFNSLRSHIYTPKAISLTKQLNSDKQLNKNREQRLEYLTNFLNNFLTRKFTIKHLNPLLEYLIQREDALFLADLISSILFQRRQFTTALVFSMLSKDDMVRLKELMECKIKTDTDIRIFTNRVTAHLIRKLKTIKLDSPSSVTDLQTIAKVIAAGFKVSEQDTTGGQALATLLGSNAINDEILKRIVDYLMEDPKVLVSKTEINRIEAQLRNANLPSRTKLILRLRQKNSTHQRWMNTENLSDLVNELQTLEQKVEEVRPEVMCALYAVIMKKAIIRTPIALDELTWLLPKFLTLEKRLSPSEAKNYRSNFNQALTVAINYALTSCNFNAFDKLWELRPFRNYPADNIIIFALAYFGQNDHRKVHSILSELKEVGVTVDDKTLNWVLNSDYIRIMTSERFVEDFLQLLAEYFPISTEWRRCLIGKVQLNDLHHSINKGKLEEVVEKLAIIGESVIKEPATSFILIDLLKAAIKTNNAQVFAQTKEFIETHKDRYTTVLYIGLSFLELNDQRWPVMLKKISHIPADILRHLIIRQKLAKRADVLHALFNVMNKPETSSIELEILLEETVYQYYSNNNLEGLRIVFDEVRNSPFYLSAKLKVKIETNIKTLEKKVADQDATFNTQQPPKSSSPSENNHPLK